LNLLQNCCNTPLHHAGPLLYITFTANGITPGAGFSLKYEGIGEDDKSGRTYKLHHSSENLGSLMYPNTPGLNFPSNEFLSFVIQPQVNQTVSVTMGSVDLGYSGIYCDRNLLTLYECDHGRVAFRLRYVIVSRKRQISKPNRVTCFQIWKENIYCNWIQILSVGRQFGSYFTLAPAVHHNILFKRCSNRIRILFLMEFLIAFYLSLLVSMKPVAYCNLQLSNNLIALHPQFLK
jgi:hypothetical protein